MLHILKKSLLAAFQGLPRPSRRTAPLMVELESRRLLSGQGTGKTLVESVRSSAADPEIHTPEAAKTAKQTKFVDGLYEKYLHRGPEPAELSYALELLASGMSQAAFKHDFTDIVSKTSKKIGDQTYMSALYTTIAGHAPTAAGQSYWQGLLASGESHAQVSRCSWRRAAFFRRRRSPGPARRPSRTAPCWGLPNWMPPPACPEHSLTCPPRARSLWRAIRR